MVAMKMLPQLLLVLAVCRASALQLRAKRFDPRSRAACRIRLSADIAPQQPAEGAGLPPPADLADEVLLQIVLQQTTDEETNELVWKYLGYSRDPATGGWDATNVFPNWRSRFPTPPDLVGVTRQYSREVDEPVLRAVQALQRSVPSEHKDRLRPTLRPLGWSGFKLDGLTPNKTRRAQVATWLLYYRAALHGVPIEELKRRKAARAAGEAAAANAAPTGTTEQGVI